MGGSVDEKVRVEVRAFTDEAAALAWVAPGRA
jgi:hypothetical protein